MTEVVLIAAVARNGVIGDGAGMPWHLSEDLRFFKRTTMGHPMVMGRRTFDAMGVLPGRRSIVVTRDRSWMHADVEVAHSLDEALALAGPADTVFVVGGGEIYRLAMPFASRLFVTEVPLEPDGSVTFPEIDAAEWREVSRVAGEACTWVTYTRRKRT